MGLISTAGENLLVFLEFQQVLSSYDRDLCNPLWSAQVMPVDLDLLRGLSGFLSRRECRAFFPDHAGKRYLLSS